MKIFKIVLLLLVVNFNFVGCKEAIDKQRNDVNQTTNTKETPALFLKNIDEKNFKSLIVSQAGFLIDVRTPGEYNEGHIPGAVNIDWKNQEEFIAKIKDYAKDKPLLLYCRSGSRSGRASEYLKEQGYEKIYNLRSGFMGWLGMGYDLEK